jgi:GNAT superfamily N-acetyltransferase
MPQSGDVTDVGAEAHSAAEILSAAAAWAWFPRDSENVREELLLVRNPPRFGAGVRGSQVDSTLDAAAVLDAAVARTKAWGESHLTLWTSPADRPDLGQELRRRGAEHVDTVTVFARAAGDGGIAVPAEVTTEVVRSLDQVREVDAINVPVWQQLPLDEAGLRAEHAEVSAAWEARQGFRVVARLDGHAVSTGGCTIEDGFVRLWGASTLEEHRGRGAYRAVLAARLRESAAWGARTALVKGRVSTSAPILARAGFTHYGDEHAYRLTV